ncbi:hypothetical protein G9A89_013757 [Geosiphon pyriformis]|nr:hypothetical protein G9A89_013757 [Geosiphon pyriformis]
MILKRLNKHVVFRPVKHLSVYSISRFGTVVEKPPHSSRKVVTSIESPTLKHAEQTLDSIQLPLTFGKNQHIPIDDDMKGRLKTVLEHFQAPIRYAFAYGSGVFPQRGYDSSKSKPMIDFIFGVSHPQHWHSLNLAQYPEHYSIIRMLGSGPVSFLQEKIGAGIYYNPYVKIDGMLIKYGVVSIDTLCRDLLDWETLYIAGRMQKPIKILKDYARVRLANQVNLANALRTALLLLPKEFTEYDLYLKIAGLSYQGDFRSYIGENPKKIENMVSWQMENFKLLYSGIFVGLSHSVHIGNKALQQDDSPKARARLIQKLPSTLKAKIKEQHCIKLLKKGENLPTDDFEACKSIANSPEYSNYVNTGISSIVSWPAFTQSMKGPLTAGIYRSTKYVGNKLAKWLKRA